jgi:agmatine deiminase
MTETPFSLGYRMPAEWERHSATWLAWPKDPTTFPPDIIGNVEHSYVKMIRSLSEGERISLLVDDVETKGRVLSLIGQNEKVDFHLVKTVDVWIRDYGPIFVKNRDVAVVKWIFNAWGEKYQDLISDNQSGKKVSESTGFKIFEPQMILEGGSIDVNGFGTGLTTKQCLLNKNRNPTMNAKDLAEYLKQYLGITHLIWLEKGISGDDTDGHIDDLARFVNKNTIVCMVEEDLDDVNYGVLEQNLHTLEKSKDQEGRKFNVVSIPMPKRIDAKDGRLPASYANFYIGNSSVLVPTFNDSNDGKALAILGELFPDRKVVGIDCKSLVYGLGTVHCVTQQQPS